MDIYLLAQQFYDYSNLIRGYSPKTIQRYRSSIELYCKISNIKTIQEVSEMNVRDFFIHGRSFRKWSPNTFISYHKSLLVFFRWCVEREHLKENYITNIETPKLVRSLPKKLKKEDALRLLDVVYNFPYHDPFLRYRNHAIFATFIYAGLRKSELFKLRLTDVDLENLTIFINKGKGSKDRFVPMSYTLAQLLKRYLKERQRLKKSCPEFFTSVNRNKGYTDSGLKRLVRKIKGASGIEFNIHRLRHTFATLMIEGGCDIYSLSRMMGHSDITTTTIYLSASAEHLRGEMLKHPLN
jgi:site-specific recombinase XerD